MPAVVAVGAEAPALVDCRAAITSLMRARTAAPASFAIVKLAVWDISAFSVLNQNGVQAFAFEAQPRGSEVVCRTNGKRVHATSSA
jgi:hypothetical protein